MLGGELGGPGLGERVVPSEHVMAAVAVLVEQLGHDENAGLPFGVGLLDQHPGL
ncbi:hypothetical protein D3C86_1844260 [compost metagenome]